MSNAPVTIHDIVINGHDLIAGLKAANIPAVVQEMSGGVVTLWADDLVAVTGAYFAGDKEAGLALFPVNDMTIGVDLNVDEMAPQIEAADIGITTVDDVVREVLKQWRTQKTLGV